MADKIECDYLVVGAGASCLAFVDKLLSENAKVHAKRKGQPPRIVIVDERDSPGGHWNDTYSFARLHQESRHYGVSSQKLEPVSSETETEDSNTSGRGKLGHRASTSEILVYFAEVMDYLLSTGHVEFLPKHTYNGERVVSCLSGETMRVEVRKKVVRTHKQTAAGATRSPPFAVQVGAVVVPPQHLPHLKKCPSRYVVIGAGRQGIDVVMWLLQRGVDAWKIKWVMPRDQWFECREAMVGDSWLRTNNNHNVAALLTSGVDELLEELGRRHLLCTLDPSRKQESFHGNSLSQTELATLRTVTGIIRMGYVKMVAHDHLLLDQGKVPLEPNTMCVDCTSSWIRDWPDPVPIFAPKLITLQPVAEIFTGAGEFNMCTSSAFIALLEVMRPASDDINNSSACPMRYPDTIEEWLLIQSISCNAVKLWSNARVLDFIFTDRLSNFSEMSLKAQGEMMSPGRSELGVSVCAKLTNMMQKDGRMPQRARHLESRH